MFPQSLSVYATVALAVLSGVSAQDLSSTHNVTSLLGSWSSGSGAVMTGPVSICCSLEDGVHTRSLWHIAGDE